MISNLASGRKSNDVCNYDSMIMIRGMVGWYVQDIVLMGRKQVTNKGGLLGLAACNEFYKLNYNAEFIQMAFFRFC